MSAKQCFAQVLRVLLPLCAALSLSAAEAVRITPVGKVEKKTDSEFGVDYWDLQANSAEARLKVVVRVSPTKQTFLTVRHKGGGGTGGVAFLCDENGTECKPYCNLDESGLYGRRPGSFFYQTIGIPMELTKGKKRITVHIGATGGGARGIYEVHTHTNPLFRPAADTNHGRIVKPYEFPRFKPLPRSVVSEARKKLLDLMSGQCDRNAREQLWAPDWREKVKSGEWPADLVGAYCVQFIKDKDGNLDVQAMKNRLTWHYERTNNFGPMLNTAIMAIAYSTPGTRQYKDKVLLERIALAIDFQRRAQAANGSYYSVWHKATWTGGPNRLAASGTPLEGAGHCGFAHAFILCGKDMEKAGLLDEKIDDDCNPDTPPIPRRKAYLDLFSASAAYLNGRKGHAPNQEMFQLEGLFMQIDAMRMLNAPKDRFPDVRQLEERARIACGAVPLGTWTWVSPKGISLEAHGWDRGGYTCEYGREQVTMYYRLYQHGGYRFAKERARIAGFGFTEFVFPLFTEAKTHGVAICAFLNTRHRNHVGGDRLFPPCYFQALVFRNPFHIRLFQLIYMNLKPGDVQGWRHPMSGNWFYTEAYAFMRNPREQLKLIQEFCDPNSPLCEDVRLPMEHGAPNFVWSDEIAQVVAFKDGDKRVMMSFNQWHGGTGSGYSFIDFQSTEYDQLLRIPHDVTRDENGAIRLFAFHSLVLGDWYIAMNANFKDAVKVQVPPSFMRSAKSIVNLATGKEVKRTFMLPAQTTIVIRRK